MAAATGLLVGGALLSGGIGLYGSMKEAEALEAQGKFQKQQYEFNAILAEYAGEDAIKRGKKEAREIRLDTRKLVGSQRAALAAQGLDPDSGDSAAVVDETRLSGELDALTTINNAYRESFGYKMEAANSRVKGKFAQIAARQKADNAILTGGLGFLASAFQGAGKALGG